MLCGVAAGSATGAGGAGARTSCAVVGCGDNPQIRHHPIIRHKRTGRVGNMIGTGGDFWQLVSQLYLTKAMPARGTTTGDRPGGNRFDENWFRPLAPRVSVVSFDAE